LGSLPPNEVTTPRKTGTERESKHEISPLETSLRDRFGHANRNGGGGGVAILVDIIKNLLLRKTELRPYHLIDAKIRLVRDDEVDLLRS
jgi:hypothetical protein